LSRVTGTETGVRGKLCESSLDPKLISFIETLARAAARADYQRQAPKAAPSSRKDRKP
jgi:hypothetical protein